MSDSSQKEKVGLEYKIEKPVEEIVVYEKVSDHVAKISLNRPESGNAFLVPETFLELKKKFDIARLDDSVKCVILAGKGKHFCTGDDMRRTPYDAFGAKPGVIPPVSVRLTMDIDFIYCLYDILTFPKTTICEAKGRNWEGGVYLVLLTDMVVAAESATFTLHGQRLGIAGGVPVLGLKLLLTMGPNRYREWVLTGRTLTAKEAKDWGLFVNEVVPDDQLEKRTLEWAETVALHNTDGLVMSKIFFNMYYDVLGMAEAKNIGLFNHVMFQNIKFRPDEYNFMKYRRDHGTKEAVLERDRRWAQYGWD